MAERRMFSKSILESDAFSDLPIESQMLYVRLNLYADDDGFVANPRSIMRMYGISNDSMRLLIEKHFVLAFRKGDNFIYLIKHWRVHNYIQKDRYKASTYKEFLRDIYLDENKAYSKTSEGHIPAIPDSASGVDTDCIQTVYEVDTQDRVRIDKDSIGKVSIDKGSIDQSMNEPAAGSDSQKYDLDTCNERIKRLVKTGLIKEADGLYDYYRQLGINTINPNEVKTDDN